MKATKIVSPPKKDITKSIEVPPVALNSCASVQTSCEVKLFCLLFTINLPFLVKVHLYTVCPYERWRSNPAYYRPFILFSCLSKDFETILNRKFRKQLAISDPFSNLKYGYYTPNSFMYSTRLLLNLVTIQSNIRINELPIRLFNDSNPTTTFLCLLCILFATQYISRSWYIV